MIGSGRGNKNDGGGVKKVQLITEYSRCWGCEDGNWEEEGRRRVED